MLQEYLSQLSALSRGSAEEKISWIFSLYDTGRKGFLEVGDVAKFLDAIHRLLRRPGAGPGAEAATVLAHSKMIFKRWDPTGRGNLTREDFLKICLGDAAIAASIDFLGLSLRSDNPRRQSVWRMMSQGTPVKEAESDQEESHEEDTARDQGDDQGHDTDLEDDQDEGHDEINRKDHFCGRDRLQDEIEGRLHDFDKDPTRYPPDGHEAPVEHDHPDGPNQDIPLEAHAGVCDV